MELSWSLAKLLGMVVMTSEADTLTSKPLETEALMLLDSHQSSLSPT